MAIEHIDIEGSVLWEQRPIGKRQFEITLPTKYKAMTGAAVTETLKIREWHRLIKIEIKHTDANKANSTDALTWFVERDFLGCTNGIKMISYTNSTVIDFSELFGEGYEYPQAEYRFSFNTTNLHRIYLKVFVQKTRELMKE